MKRTVNVVFDGEALHPEEPLDLEPDRRYQVTIEETSAGDEVYPLQKCLQHSRALGVSDLTEQHDHYLYGTPKR
ncbi:MAG: hypothetical protein U0531_07300 [Dehalococcoidia bacterium]